MKTNKNFLKKLTAGILGFVMTLGVGAAGYAGAAGESKAAAATPYTWSATSADKDKFSATSGTATLGAVTWNYTQNKVSTYNFSSNCIQIGQNGNTSGKVTLSANFTDPIKKVTVECSSYNNSSKVLINVCGNEYVKSINTAKWTTIGSVGGTEISSPEAGNVYIEFSGSTRALYLKSIKVEFGEVPVGGHTVSFNKGTYGTGTMPAWTHKTSIDSEPVCLFEPSNENYDFDYWSVNGSKVTYPYAVESDVTFTANWKVSTTVKDKLIHSDLAATSTSYTNFSNVTKHTAVYAGNSARNQNGTAYRIQIRSDSPSGIVSTVSGGKIKKVIFGDNSDFNGKTITVYGKNEAYTGSAELSDTSKRGTSLGLLTEDGTISVIGDYSYVGIKSSGAAYLGSITFVWEPVATHTVTISGGASSIYAGGTTKFSASCDQTGCDGITWASSNTSVASILNGKVIGLSAGQTTISATCAEGGSDSVILTVQANALVLSPASISDAQKGGTGSITASLSGVSGETVSYVWESDQPSNVSVTGNTATATLSYENGGTATITCTATVNDIEFSNTCSVTVLTKDPTASFDNPTTEGYTGIQYDFTAVSANIDNGTWSWKVNGQDFTFDDDLDDDGYSIRYATFSEAGLYTITATCTGDDDATATANTTIVITASSSVLTIDQTQVVLQKGSSVSVTPTLVVTGSYADSTNITVTPSSGVTVNKTTTTSGSAVQITAGSTGGATKVTFSANGQDVDCSISIPSTTSDTIASEDLVATGTTYENFSGVTKNTAVYAGNSQKGNNGEIGFRSSNSNSGIVSTTSGGIISKVIVTWENTTASRQLDVYGKNTAYEAASDLYADSTRGDSLGSLVYTSASDNNTEVSINGSYQYVGVRSKSGLTTIADITFVWSDPVAVESVTAGQDSISVAKGASSQLTWTVLPADASNKAVELSMDPVLTGVTISDAGLVSVDSTATVGDETTIKIASKENSSIFDTVDLTILPTYLDNNKVLGRTGFTKFTTEQTFASVRGSENYIEAKYIDGSTKTSKGDNASMWSNTKCYVNNGTEDSPNWVEYNMSSAITNADNGKQFKFVYTETVNNQTYTQTSNPFTISVDNVTIKSAITLYYSNSDSYVHSHDFTQDTEYSATGTVTWSVVNAYSKASITQLGVLTIDGAPSNVGASMQFIVRAICGACTRECTVTLKCEPATSVSVDWPDTIAHEASGTFTATVETEYARQAVCWTSDNEALTITPQSNKLKASWSTIHLESDVDVHVTAFVDEDGDETYTEGEAIERKTITIHAAEIPVTEINITEEDIEIWQDDDDAVNKAQFTLHATVTESASVQKALWSIVEGSDNVVQSSGQIYEGLSKSWKFTGNAGTATIRATSMNKENEQVYDELTVTVKASVLTDITIDASASTIVKEFEKDHVLTASDYEGLVVTASYQSGNDRTVTPTSVTCDTSKVGTSTVVVSYTLNNVTKTDSYQVTIHAPSSANILTNQPLPGKDVYTLVTDISKIETGNYVIAAKVDDNYNALPNSFSISSGKIVPTNITVNSSNEITSNNVSSLTLSIVVGDNGLTISNGNKYLTYNGSTDLSTQTNSPYYWTVSAGSHGTFRMTSSTAGRGLIFRAGTTNKFGGYSLGNATSTSEYYDVEIFKAIAQPGEDYFVGNSVSDALYSFVDTYGESLSVENWDTVFSSNEYKALSADDKALLKNGVASGKDKDGSKSSTRLFADFFNAYDAIAKQYGPEYNDEYLGRDVEYNKYRVSINGVTVATDQVAGTSYTLPTKVSDKVAVSYTIDGETYDPGETIKLHENVVATAELITDVATISVSTEANFSYSLDNQGSFSEITKTTLRMYIELDADTYNYYVSQGYDFSIALSNSSSGKTSKIASSQMSVEYDEEKGVYIFNVALNIPSAQYDTSLAISLVATKSGEEDVSTKSVSVSYKAAAQALYDAYEGGTATLTDNQLAALKAILGIK